MTTSVPITSLVLLVFASSVSLLLWRSLWSWRQRVVKARLQGEHQ